MPPYYLPPQAVKFLADPPPPGQQIHHWLFRAALLLHKCKIPPVEIEILITQSVAKVGRDRSAAEIADAVSNSAPAILRAKNPARGVDRKSGAKRSVKKGQNVVDRDLRRRVIEESSLGGLDGLKRISPKWVLEDEDPRWFLEQLFPGDPLVCLAVNKCISFTRRLSEYTAPLAFYELIVPSPMSAAEGLTKCGKVSNRCLENVGPRHYLVTEFDTGNFDVQAAAIGDLTRLMPLVMVVFSGGKSLHAWWRVKDLAADRVESFLQYAVKLGADPATKSPVQLCRLPSGTRNGRTPQSVFYFDPDNVCDGKEGA